MELATYTYDAVPYKFTGYERDPETGNDYAFARYYNPRLGRFMTPDQLGGGIGDPQSHNRYAYVGNNPINLTDPSGLCGQAQGTNRFCREAPNGFFDLNGGTAGDIPGAFLFGLLGLANGDIFGLVQAAGEITNRSWDNPAYGGWRTLKALKTSWVAYALWRVANRFLPLSTTTRRVSGQN
jgi:RHS repeat-associated protein